MSDTRGKVIFRIAVSFPTRYDEPRLLNRALSRYWLASRFSVYRYSRIFKQPFLTVAPDLGFSPYLLVP